MLTAQQRADAARRQILEAAISLSGPRAHTVSSWMKSHSLNGVGLALLAGFLVGYSPLVRAIAVRNGESLVRTLLSLKYLS